MLLLLHRSNDAENLAVVLVDTSIWVAHIERAILQQHVALSEVTICMPVIQEVLQGIRAERAHAFVRRTLLAFPIIESPLTVEVFEEAAEIYRTGRITGFTIRSSFDCLIAACAIRNDVPLLHSDRDFNTIARFTRLQSRYVAL